MTEPTAQAAKKSWSDWVERLGHWVTQEISGAGYGVVLLGAVFRSLRQVVPKRREILHQMYLCGVMSLPVAAMVAFFTGMVLALQTGIELMKYGSPDQIGSIVAASMAREMGPIWIGVILAARVGSSLAAEIGTMRVSEEIDALEVMSIDPVRFLVFPRVVALVLMSPILTIYANLLGVLGGGIVGYYQIRVSFTLYLRNALDSLVLTDIFSGLIKAAVFGTIIAVVGCSKGLRTTHGAEGVGRATRDSVVVSLVLILIFNYLITSITRYFY